MKNIHKEKKCAFPLWRKNYDIIRIQSEEKRGIAMEEKKFQLDDIVEMKKPHPCGNNQWRIIRMGADIRIKCLGCSHSVMMPRREFVRKMKKVIGHFEES